MKISLRQLAPLCAVAGALFVGQASAAVKVSEVFNGPYYDMSANGRGISMLFAPTGDGSHVVFGALYTYDNSGEPSWLILQDTFLENQFESDSVPVLRFTGGAFGFPYDNAGVASEQIGTATIRVDSCHSIYVDLTMDADSGFDDVELGDLAPVSGGSPNCVYQEEFTSCPAFSTPSAVVPRGCELSGVITQDVTLTNDITWVFNGLVRFGNDNANSMTLTIEPGTVMIGKGAASDYAYIEPGSRIIANGTPLAPIVWTSPQDGFIEGTVPQPGDVGGIVVSGNAPANACPEAPFDCRSEFDETLRFGGDQPHESSGEMSYIQVRYAGYVFAPNREVNSFTFQAVGDGTIIHHLQSYQGKDDCVEFFGGTAQVKYFACTQSGDDGVDWDLGFSGKLQYGLVEWGEGFGEDFGIEGASNPDSFDAMPRAIPTLANFTFLGHGHGSSGILHKQGSSGHIYNTIVKDFGTSCIEFRDTPATFDAAGTPESPTGDTTFDGVIVDCDTNFKTADGAPWQVGDFFNSSAFENNEEIDPMLEANGGYMPLMNSPALSNAAEVRAEHRGFIDQTSYRGGFDGMNDWTVPWTYKVNNH